MATLPTTSLPAEYWADVGQLRMRYLDWGGDGPPVVALHGLASCGHWYDLVAPLLRSQFRVIAPDQRGHGKTTAAPTGYDWRTLSADVVGLLDKLGVERAAVLGHSWGGNVAINLAALHPERVSALVMIDGGFFDGRLRPGATYEWFKARLAPRNVSGTRAEFLTRLREQLAVCWNSEIERIVQTMVWEDNEGQIHDILHPDHHAQTLHAMWHEPAHQTWPRIQCPTLLVPAGPLPERAGSEFVRQRQELVEAAARAIPDCRLRWIPETIHDIGYHKPHQLAQAIREFLDAGR